MVTDTGGVTMAKRRIGGYTTTREVYKTVKKYDHQQFDEFCTRITPMVSMMAKNQ